MPVLLLDFLPRLPEEEIGADRRAEDCHDSCDVAGVEMEIGQKQTAHRRLPIDIGDNQHATFIRG